MIELENYNFVIVKVELVMVYNYWIVKVYW